MEKARLARIQAVVLTDRLNPGLLTAYEVTALGRYPHTGFLGRLGPNDHRAVARALDMVKASHLAHRFYERLSDGEKQKIILARALAQEPRLILLDEPTVHLDLKHRLEVMAILRNLCRELGITVVASLHDVDMASRLSDQAALVTKGGLVDFGPPELVLDNASVARLYKLEGARYDSCLGVMELLEQGKRGPVFVVPGGGSATNLLRLLHKRGYRLFCGVAHQGDMDHHLAQVLGAKIVSVSAFEQAAQEDLAKALVLISKAKVVIDSGFRLGQANQANKKLLKRALQTDKQVFSLRPEKEAIKLLGQQGKLCCCADELDLAHQVSNFFHALFIPKRQSA
jgi:iron complex transport system ATP-binding protein